MSLKTGTISAHPTKKGVALGVIFIKNYFWLAEYFTKTI